MSKKIILVVFAGFLGSALLAKTYIYKIDNGNGNFFVTIQSSADKASNTILRRGKRTNLQKLRYTLEPNQLLDRLDDFVIPSIDDGSQIKIKVQGVTQDGRIFTKTDAKLQEQNDQIVLVGANIETQILPTNKNLALIIDKEGNITLE
jgi:hypothetical protein